MFIETEMTPNPDTLKFLPGKTLLEAGTANFTDVDAAKSSPLASRNSSRSERQSLAAQPVQSAMILLDCKQGPTRSVISREV